MSQQDYFEPVRYQPPPRKPWRFPRWLLVVIVVVIVLVGLASAALNIIGRAFREQMQANLPDAAVVIGQPLAWRELGRKTLMPFNSGMLGGLFVDDFDADGDEEVLAIHPTEKAGLYEVNGDKSVVPITGMQYMMGGVSWDYDRDGVAEIVVETLLGDVQRGARQGRSAEDIFMSTDLPVYDLNGHEVKRLPAVAATFGSMLVADIDGDGWDELLAGEPEANASFKSCTLLAFGDHGKQITKLQTNSIVFSTTGDVDADGRDELVTLTNRLNDLVAEGQDQQPETLYQSPHGIHPLVCTDTNGDGYAEVVLARSSGFELSYFDCLSKKTTMLAAPVLSGDQWTAVTLYATAGRYIAGLDTIIAVSAGMHSGILLFDTTGKCIHYEEFGDMVWGVRTVHAGGQDYLIVQLSDRLLIYP